MPLVGNSRDAARIDNFPFKCVFYTFLDLATGMQVVCNANRLSGLVNEKKKKQNWLDYYQLKYARNQSKKPIIKVNNLL